MKPETEIQTNFFVNEFPGEELEMKLQLLNLDPFTLVQELHTQLSTEGIGDYITMPTMSTLREMTYHMETFGAPSENQDLKQVFVMVHPVSKGLYRCKTKSPGKPFSVNHPTGELVTRRSESKVGGFSSRDELITDFKNKLRTKPISVGKFTRTKMFIYLTNKNTLRNYCIGGDLCTHENGQQMSQLEIEYKGRAGIGIPGKQNEEAVLEDFQQIAQIISNQYPNQIETTNLTKFNWAKSMF